MKVSSLRISTTVLLSFFITFILSSGCRNPVGRKVTADLTGAELVKAYDSDVQAADKAYKGRTFTISGRVEGVLPIGPPGMGPLKDLSGLPLVFMENQRLACTFAPGQYESAPPKIGQVVVLACRGDGKYGARVVVSNCVIK